MSMLFHICHINLADFPLSIYYDIEGEDIIVKALLDDRFGPARIAEHVGPQFS